MNRAVKLRYRVDDVFSKVDITEHTPWGPRIALDHIHVPARRTSQMQLYDADTYLFVIDGHGFIFIDGEEVRIDQGSLLHIPSGASCCVRTNGYGITFLSMREKVNGSA